MPRFRYKFKFLAAILVASIFVIGGLASVYGQQGTVKSQEVSEIDGRPVLLRHLPDYDRVQAGAVFATDKPTLQNALGNRPVLELLDISGGTEAVTAAYPPGRLVIVEFTNPQSSADADAKIHEYLTTNPQSQITYRRIGNYNVFVFDASDAVAANSLLDQVKYEKTVQWLGEDPFLMRRLERYMMATSRDVAISTVLAIVIVIGTAVLAGIVAGFIFFGIREQRRAGREAFSDAGGLTRLNLDGLTTEVESK